MTAKKIICSRVNYRLCYRDLKRQCAICMDIIIFQNHWDINAEIIKIRTGKALKNI